MNSQRNKCRCCNNNAKRGEELCGLCKRRSISRQIELDGERRRGRAVRPARSVTGATVELVQEALVQCNVCNEVQLREVPDVEPWGDTGPIGLIRCGVCDGGTELLTVYPVEPRRDGRSSR